MRSRAQFERERLPDPLHYFEAEGLQLIGRGAWRSAVCPFHDDHHPSMRVNMETGAFRCMACGVHGGDVLAFHSQKYGLAFRKAAQALGAWGKA